MELSAEFKKLVEEQAAKPYEEAEVFNNWMPPDGTYTVVLTDCQNGMSETEAGERYGWVRLTGVIQAETDPELDQKEFTVGFYRTDRAHFKMKNDVAVLAGRKVDSFLASLNILEQAARENWIVTVEVSRGTSRNTGRTFTNTRIVEVLPSEQAAQPVAT